MLNGFEMMDIKYADSFTYTFVKDEAGTYYSPWFDISWANEIFAYKTITLAETRTGGETESLSVERDSHSSVVINACDATTGWTGTSLSIDTDDKKEGTGSLKDNVASPSIGNWYHTTYNPTGSWDWSAKEHILFWLKSDRPSTAFTSAWLMIYDTSDNYRYWHLTFSAGEWTAVKKVLATGDGQSGTPPNLTLIDKVIIQFRAADTTPFYKKIDDLRFSETTLFTFTSRTGTHVGEEKYGREMYDGVAPGDENKLGTRVRFALTLGGTTWTADQEYTVTCTLYAKRN